MTEENKDLNTDQLVADPDLNKTDAVDQSGLQDQAATGQETDEKLADGTDANKPVPYAELQKATTARKEAEEKAAYAQRQLELVQMSAQQQTQTQQAPPKTTMEQALTELGLTADDLYDGNNQIKVQARKDQLDAGLRQQQNATMQTQQFMMTHPDVAQVVGSVNPMTGQIMQPTAELMAIVATKPYLSNASTQDIYAAVLEDRKFKAYAKTAEIQKEHQIRQNVDTQTQPMGGSAAGGGGAGVQSGQQLLARETTLEIERKLAAGEIP